MKIHILDQIHGVSKVNLGWHLRDQGRTISLWARYKSLDTLLILSWHEFGSLNFTTSRLKQM